MGNKSLTIEKIISVAIAEFAEKGYEGASTNAIASRAKVSKGVIFLHFNNKEGLYLKCLDKILDGYQDDFDLTNVKQTKDIFDRLEKFIKLKSSSIVTKPNDAKFLASCYTMNESQLKEKAVNKVNAFALPIKSEVFNFDYQSELYKEGITKEKVLKMLAVILAGFEHIYSNNYDLKSLENLFKEWNDIIRALKHGIMR